MTTILFLSIVNCQRARPVGRPSPNARSRLFIRGGDRGPRIPSYVANTRTGELPIARH